MPSDYAVKLWLDRFYVELSIEGSTRSDEILVTLFAQAIKTKGNLTGTLIDSLRPIIGRLQVDFHPSDHFGFGAGYLAAVINRLADKGQQG